MISVSGNKWSEKKLNSRIIEKIWRGYYIRRITNCEYFYDSEFPFGSYDEYWSGSDPD